MAAAQACPRWQAHPHLGEAGRVPPGRLRGSTALPTPPSRRLAPRTFRQCTSVASSHLVCGSDMMASDTNTLPSGSPCAGGSRTILCIILSPYEEKSKCLTAFCEVEGSGSSPLSSLVSSPCGPATWTTSQLLERVKASRRWAFALAARGLPCSPVRSIRCYFSRLLRS